MLSPGRRRYWSLMLQKIRLTGRSIAQLVAPLTRFLLLAFTTFSLIFVAADTASAIGVAFQSSSLPRQLRSEGTTETAGELALLASNSGTIKSGSTISVNYGAAIEPGTGTVTCSPAACTQGVNFTAGIAGSTLTITFTTDVAFGAAEYLVIAQVRLDASSSFGNISAILSASSSSPGTNPITFTNAFLPVGTVISPSTSVQITPASALSVCSPSAKAFSVKVTEAFPSAFTSAADENLFANVGAPGVDPMGAGELDTTLRLSFTGIPEDVTVTFTGFGGSGTLTPATSFMSFTATGGSQTVDVDVALTVTDLASVENVIVNFTASAMTFNPGTASVSVSLRGGSASPNVPRFAANVQGSGNPLSVVGPSVFAVLNGASFILRAVAPGSQAALFGSCLATGTASAASLPLPTTLVTTSVLINGLAAPLFFVSSGQINLQIPWELAGETEVSVVVDVDGVTSTAFMLQIAPTDPGIFTTNSSGTGQGSIFNDGTSQNSPENPAAPGDVVAIFCTGLGAVTNQPASGEAASGEPLSVTIQTPTVTIGGLPATVLFSGLAPGFVGQYQVNVQISADVSGGDAVPVVITIGGVQSNTVTMAITVTKRRRGQLISD